MATPQTRRAPNPGETNSRNDQPARISAAILATVALPVPFKRAVFRMPVPAASEARTASSRSGDIFGRPNAFPLLVPAVRALAMPARTLSTIRLRSNSRINSYRWYPQPANVSADYSTAPRATNVRSAPLDRLELANSHRRGFECSFRSLRWRRVQHAGSARHQQ